MDIKAENGCVIVNGQVVVRYRGPMDHSHVNATSARDHIKYNYRTCPCKSCMNTRFVLQQLDWGTPQLDSKYADVKE